MQVLNMKPHFKVLSKTVNYKVGFPCKEQRDISSAGARIQQLASFLLRYLLKILLLCKIINRVLYGI